MPLLTFKCPNCNSVVKRLAQRAKIQLPTCKTCNKEMDRDVQPITAQAVETIDNGQMNKALTRPVNAEELYHDKTKRKA